MSLVTSLLTALVAAAPAPHEILVLDDSGSMELQYDVHGYGLAVPELFHQVLGDGLSVFLLAQDGPRGDVPRLGPSEFLAYPRQNGTYYRKAIEQAIHEAEDVLGREPDRAIDILLVTDAEPSDSDARRAIDRALAAHPRLAFHCVLLGTDAEGDLCAGRATAAADGFEMAQRLATHLAKSLGSIPQWGRLGGAALTTTIPLGKFVKRAHMLLLGARAGEDFSATVDGHALTTDHTRPLMPAAMLRMQALAQGLGVATTLPVGPSPRLALASYTLDAHTAHDITLALTHADGDVAWAVMLEYDLVAAAQAPARASGTIAVRTQLMHDGVHVDDRAALAALGLQPVLSVTPVCKAACPAARELPLTLDGQGWAEVSVPVEDGVDQYRFEARFTSASADLRAPPVTTVVDRAALTEATPIPTPTPPPSTAEEPAPIPTATQPEPAPIAAPPTTTITRWIPPFLALPEWQIAGRELGYALTVTQTDGKALSAAEIEAQHLTAALVVDGRELPMKLVGDRFEATFPTGQPGTREVRLRLHTPDGPLDSNPDTMEVLPDVHVRLPPTLDAGTVDAGCDATARCVPTSLGSQSLGSQSLGSQGSDGLPLTVTRTPEGTWPDVRLTLRRGDATWSLERDAPVLVPSGDGALEICVAPPGCSDAPADAYEVIDVAPGDPRLATPDRTARTRVVATVTPSTWLDCNLWWVVLVVTGLLLGFLIYGWIRPLAFPLGAMVQVADQERRLARDPGRPLRAVPHGRKGFYRTATCAFDASGYTVKASRRPVLVLKAERGAQIALQSRGATIERRQRGAWVAVDRASERFLLSGAIYRINGSFFFKVLA